MDPETPTIEASAQVLKRERSQLQTISLMILAAVAATVALKATQSILVPFVLAMLLSYLVSPIVDILQTKLKAPRFVAMIAGFCLIAAGVGLLVLLLVTSLGGLAENEAIYEAKIEGWAEQVSTQLSSWGLDLKQDEVVDDLGALTGELLGGLGSAAGSLMSFLSASFLVLIFVIYLILGHRPSEERVGIWGEIDVKVRRYLATKVLTSAATGILVGLVLWIIGLDLALVFGVMAFLLNFIPSVGSIIATLLPLPLAAVQFDATWQITLVLVLPLCIQLVVGNGIEPKLMGESLDLHPVTVLLALCFWGFVWGAVGMLLATPITAVGKIVLERFQTTKPAAELLAGRLPEF
jgi:AI-2 transport protein TqsA